VGRSGASILVAGIGWIGRLVGQRKNDMICLPRPTSYRYQVQDEILSTDPRPRLLLPPLLHPIAFQRSFQDHVAEVQKSKVNTPKVESTRTGGEPNNAIASFAASWSNVSAIVIILSPDFLASFTFASNLDVPSRSSISWR
jgi:hypothetical protein